MAPSHTAHISFFSPRTYLSLSCTGTYEITLLYPSHDRDEPVRQCNFKGVTRSFLQRLLMPENGFAGLIPLSELPDGEADVALDEVRIHIPEFVELVNGGMYLVVNLRTPISEQVRF